MFKKILAGLDSRETCAVVFKEALRLAQVTGAELQLIGVIGPVDSLSPPILAESGKSYNLPNKDQSVWNVYQDLHQEFADKEQVRLNSFAEQAKAAGVATEFVQRVGNPGQAICQQAQESEADVIMVGSHGRTGLSELLIGSVSNYVLHHAPCSVFVLRK